MSDATFEAMASKFGIVEVADAAVPELRERNADTERWQYLKEFLPADGKWRIVKDYTNGSAGVVSSNINNDKNKTLSAADFEARHDSVKGAQVTDENGKKSTPIVSSRLYLRRIVKPAGKSADKPAA